MHTQRPQQGLSIKGTLLVLPGIKGSTAGPGALLECLYAGNGPAALLLCEVESSAIIAVTAYEALTEASIPVVEISTRTATALESGSYWCIAPPQLKAASKS
nr:DUF126 domain-containing protein [Oceanicoccus sagamiensis]